ncbi:hypothetical protein LDENG_00082020 [Lucifuga dentata]|nr:hypothetical protein LDENG_00082020 [Lucifuga dentata]
MARVGGFQKFLYYSIMSVICFLHPVLVWHATVPGIMLLVTAFFNFILSKKTKAKSSNRPQERDPGERVDSDINLSFLCTAADRTESVTATECRLAMREGADSIQAMLELQQRAGPKETEREGRRWKERRKMCCIGGEEPAEEMDRCCETDATSDTAPMITD